MRDASAQRQVGSLSRRRTAAATRGNAGDAGAVQITPACWKPRGRRNATIVGTAKTCFEGDLLEIMFSWANWRGPRRSCCRTIRMF